MQPESAHPARDTATESACRRPAPEPRPALVVRRRRDATPSARSRRRSDHTFFLILSTFGAWLLVMAPVCSTVFHSLPQRWHRRYWSGTPAWGLMFFMIVSSFVVLVIAVNRLDSWLSTRAARDD